MSIIEVNRLTKEYQLGSLVGLKQTAFNILAQLQGKQVKERDKFKALDDVSFTIEEGEVVGIIGHNGAGKSTLLKHLAKISNPTSGNVKIGGSVAPLIEVGAGVNPELTGRENIFLNAAILGIPKKIIYQKLDEIIEFSELEQFIDTPVKRYSTGMTVKLGFSIATSMDAEILIIDEVLAVGDLAFQRKCFDRMEDLIKKKGKTVLLVSHNIRQVERLCSRVIMLNQGKIIADDKPNKVCELFYEQNNEKISLNHRKHTTSGIKSSKEVELIDICLVDPQGKKTVQTKMGSPVTIEVTIKAYKKIVKPEIVFGIHTTDFFYLASMGNGHIEERPDLKVGINTIECKLKSLPLTPGVYCIRFGITDQFRQELFYGESLIVFTIKSDEINTSKLPVLGVFQVENSLKFGNPEH